MTTETTESAAVKCYVCGREFSARALAEWLYCETPRGKIHIYCEGAYYRGVKAS